MSEGTDGSVMLTACVVENVVFPVSAAFTYGDGAVWMSAPTPENPSAAAPGIDPVGGGGRHGGGRPGSAITHR